MKTPTEIAIIELDTQVIPLIIKRVVMMFIVDLKCKDLHFFEGWYDTVADYYKKVSKKHQKKPKIDHNVLAEKMAAFFVFQYFRFCLQIFIFM